MTPRWTDSSDKHKIARADQVWAMVHPTYSTRLPDVSIDGGTVWLYIGLPHAQTEREIEILINVYEDGREAVIFHAMELTDKFRRYKEGSSNG
jgi:hypothetical protein